MPKARAASANKTVIAMGIAPRHAFEIGHEHGRLRRADAGEGEGCEPGALYTDTAISQGHVTHVI